MKKPAPKPWKVVLTRVVASFGTEKAAKKFADDYKLGAGEMVLTVVAGPKEKRR